MKNTHENFTRRIVALVMALVMALSMIPTVAFAEDRTITFNVTDGTNLITDATITISSPTGLTTSGNSVTVDESVQEITYTVSREGYTPDTKTVTIPANGNIDVTLVKKCAVTTVVNGEGTVTVDNQSSVSVDKGTQVAVKITPASGWYVSACSGVNSCPDNGYDGSVSVNSDTAIEVTFARYLTVNTSAGAGGTVKLGDAADKDSVTVKSGDTVKVTVTPGTGHWISSVSGHDGLNYTDADKTGYTKTLAITEDTTINASFVEFFTVTVTCGENGTVTTDPAGGTVSMEKKDTNKVTVTATPDTGYRVAEVKINDSKPTSYTGNDKDYTGSFKVNTTVHITFAPNVYTVSKNEPENGTVEVAGTAEYGSTITATVKPNDGYDIDTVTVNGGNAAWSWNKENSASVSIQNVATNTTISVAFKTIASITDPVDITDNGNTYARLNAPESLFDDKYVFRKDAAVTVSAVDPYVHVRYNGGTATDLTSSTSAIPETTTISTVDVLDASNAWHRISLVTPLDIVIDKTGAGATLNAPALPEGCTHYNSDINLTASVEDIDSGISKISYKVLCNNEGTLPSTDLYTYESGDVATATNCNITVNASQNNSDNVKVILTVIDRAGNETTAEQALMINTVAPEISVEINGVEDTDAAHGYFNTERVATITVIDRDSTFNPVAVKLVNNAAENKATMPVITGWTTETTTVASDTHIATVTFETEGNYDWTVEYTNKANLSDTSISAAAVDAAHSDTIWQFTYDATDPSGEIGFETSFWNRLLDTLSFHTWRNYTVKPMVQNVEDNLSTDTSIKIEYYKDSGTSALTALGENGLTTKSFMASPTEIMAGEIASVYARITDKAGNEVYLGTGGIIVDTTAPTITLDPDNTTKAVNYNEDVIVTISVEDDGNYSGIQNVKYWIDKDGVDGKNSAVTLYNFEYSAGAKRLTVQDWDSTNYAAKVPSVTENKDVLLYSDLKNSWTGTIKIPATDYNSSNVVLHVQAADNAGVISSDTDLTLDIDATAPQISVSYTDSGLKKAEDSHGYYAADRIATVQIKERSNHFNPASATDGIVITAEDATGATVENAWKFVDASGADITDPAKYWTAGAGNCNKDTDTFTAYIKFGKDAKYTFASQYTDEAGVVGAAVYASTGAGNEAFTIDKTTPTDCEITLGNSKWTKLLQKLTFGLYKKDTVTAIASAADALSGIEKVEYYVVSDPNSMMSAEELDAQYALPSNGFVSSVELSTDDLYVVYARIADKSDNHVYVSTEGFAVDKTPSTIEFVPASGYKTEGTKYYYSKADVDESNKIKVDVTVTDGAENSDYSGIKTIKYWYTKDSVDSAATDLYTFEFTSATGTNVDNANHPTRDMLKRVWSSETETASIMVPADTYNSCDVTLYVKTVDNAGNEYQQAIALDIDITAPAIHVDFDNNTVVNEKYFTAQRVATVKITERTSHFVAASATDALKAGITAKDGLGNNVEDAYTISSWATVEGATPDDATHTATVTFAKDANYTFAPTYTDKAGNANSAVTYGQTSTATNVFTVDTAAPSGTVKVTAPGGAMEEGTTEPAKAKEWNSLAESLTFGFWTAHDINITGTATDVTSPIKSIDYCKSSGNNAATLLDKDGLDALNSASWTNIADASWTNVDGQRGFDVLTIQPDDEAVVYLRIVDMANHVTYISTDGLIADQTDPHEEYTAPEIIIQPDGSTEKIYNADVPVKVTVTDPIVNNSYSGIKSVTYKVTSYAVDGTVLKDGSGADCISTDTLYTFDVAVPTATDLCQKQENLEFTVSSATHNSNKVVIEVTAVDNAGNSNTESISIMIDITAPKINVSYDNNSGDGEGSKYFKADRTATIVVTDRNFDEKLFTSKISSSPKLTWTEKKATSGNGDTTTYTATVKFNTDADYTVELSCQDIAGNACADGSVDYQGTAPKAFTIDKTAPVVNVSYDNNDVRNGNYYKANRTATISVKEHNFDEGRVSITGTANDDGTVLTFPKLSSWSGSGDTHTATISYTADALYTFDISVKDKAGNDAADYAEDKFYVDKTVPVLTITGVEDQSANNDVVAPVITYSDTNFDKDGVTITLTGANNGEVSYAGRYSDITHGQVFTYADFERVQKVDDLYTLNAIVVDMAGNETTETIFFSANRFGSVYVFSDETAKLNGTYVQSAIDAVVTEINPDALEDIKITLFKNDKTLTLNEGADYRIEATGGNGKWHKYVYTVLAKNFEDDGVYRLQFHSVDAAKNIAENTLDTKGAELNFGIDKTPPVLTVANLETGVTYPEEKISVSLFVSDNLVLSNVKVYLDDYQKALVSWSEKELANILAGEGELTFTIGSESNKAHKVLVVCVDAAGNETTEEITDFFVTTNLLVRYYNNKALFFGSIGGTAAICAGIIAVGKKKKEAVSV